MTAPRISIVTIARNNETGLSRTYGSIISQSCTDWELILIVGKSDDSTESIARRLSLTDSRVKVYLQSGLGIYNAMNEGMEYTNCDLIWFLNSGDAFESQNSLSSALVELDFVGADLLIGGYSYPDGQKFKSFSKKSKRLSALEFAFNRRGGCHQSMIFKKKLIKEADGFDLKYPLASDFDLVLKIVKQGITFRSKAVFANIEPGGISDQRIFDVINEKHEIRKSQFPNSHSVLLGSCLWSFAVKSKIHLRNFKRDHSLLFKSSKLR